MANVLNSSPFHLSLYVSMYILIAMMCILNMSTCKGGIKGDFARICSLYSVCYFCVKKEWDFSSLFAHIKVHIHVLLVSQA